MLVLVYHSRAAAPPGPLTFGADCAAAFAVAPPEGATVDRNSELAPAGVRVDSFGNRSDGRPSSRGGMAGGDGAPDPADGDRRTTFWLPAYDEARRAAL